MFIITELITRSYKPLSLEKGMWFVQTLHKGTFKEQMEIFALDRVPLNQEEFIQQNGCPIEIALIIPNDLHLPEIIAEHHQIGWMDEGDHVDTLRDVTLKDINTIINDYDSYLELEVDDESGELILYDDKVTIRFLTDSDEYDDEYDEEEE